MIYTTQKCDNRYIYCGDEENVERRSENFPVLSGQLNLYSCDTSLSIVMRVQFWPVVGGENLDSETCFYSLTTKNFCGEELR